MIEELPSFKESRNSSEINADLTPNFSGLYSYSNSEANEAFLQMDKIKRFGSPLYKTRSLSQNVPTSKFLSEIEEIKSEENTKLMNIDPVNATSDQSIHPNQSVRSTSINCSFQSNISQSQIDFGVLSKDILLALLKDSMEEAKLAKDKLRAMRRRIALIDKALKKRKGGDALKSSDHSGRKITNKTILRRDSKNINNNQSNYIILKGTSKIKGSGWRYNSTKEANHLKHYSSFLEL